MRSVTAGGSRMCGLSLAGYVICSGGQLNVPSGEAFEFTSLAVGSSHTCTIRRHIGTVVCWGLYGSYSPAGATSFEFIIAGGDLTCGLTTASLTVACWGLNGTSLPALTISLPKVLPGVCVPDKRICSCGIYPDSETLCGGSGVICQRLDTSGTETCPLFAFKVKRPPAPPLTTLQKPSKWWFLYAVVGAVFAAAGVGFPLYFMCLRLARRGEKVMNSMLETAGGLLGIRHLEVFRFNDLKTATENFCTTCQQIAHYCVVYRGHLSDGRQVAVKRFQTQPDTLILYIKEVLILSVVRHPNLVKLIGYCKRKEEVFGVFEWMENETLHAHLHREPMNPQSVPFFTWKTRVRALLDVARGIEYLHGFPSPIIHRNINTSTILIDQSWVAKISEFGHALFASISDKINEEIDVLKLAVGCVNPLATQEQCVTPKTDVYAFGIVMLEVLTGREELENGFCLADLIVTRGNLLESLDERIAEPMGHELKALQRIMQLAQECVRRVALLRPTMNCIVSELERAVALFD
ncbi:hypothetical protein LUZ63_019461 [Rhynchospora breviuscula]|uniref:Protein kinase domain-containing protein n=1 Tax=Rhynchospora breviuscula TaxID=2022672 RepID=A0A9Q0C675_9POAL|nr:hypothetical protein LUZ63_019461 [Rhynchospora breviuscula]